MPGQLTTIGRVLVQDAVPADMRDRIPVFDKKSTRTFFTELAEKHPDQYVDTLYNLTQIGAKVSTEYGGPASLRLADFRLPPKAAAFRNKLRLETSKIANDPKLTSTEKNSKIVELMLNSSKAAREDLVDEGTGLGNSISLAASKGFRANPLQVSQMAFGDLLVADHKDKPIPIPGLHGYAEGTTPVEYWGGSYGSRKGYVSVQLGTAQTGYYAKLMTQATHKQVVTGKDCGAWKNGVEVDGSDPDIIGYVSAVDQFGVKKGQAFTKNDLKNLTGKKVLVRSLLTCKQPEGVCQVCSGKRESGRFPPIGEYVGITSARVLGEPMTQMALCLHPDTEVRMADFSIKKIKDIVIGDKVLGASVDGTTFTSNVTNVFNNGEKEVFDIVYRRGGSHKETINLKATLNHKILGMTRLHTYGKAALNGKNRIIEAGYKHRHVASLLNREYIDKENKLDVKEALLFGLLLGDGCYTESVKSVNFSCADQLLLEDTKEYMDSLGLKFTHLHDYYYKVSGKTSTGGRDIVSGKCLEGMYTNPARIFLKEMGALGKYAHEKEIPTVVKNWSNESIALLLSGLFCTDGTVYYSNAGKVTNEVYGFTSCSYALIQGVKELLALRFGIHGTAIHTAKKEKVEFAKHDIFSFIISDKYSVLRFRKHIPLFGIKKLKREGFIKAFPIEENTIMSSFYRCTRLSLKSLGMLETRDIEVDNPDHLFVLANGMIVSNSIKHTGGIASKKSEEQGFEVVKKMTDVPEHFPYKALLSPVDGKIDKIETAPQGGWYVTVGSSRLYTPQDRPLTSKEGDAVEAGDIISEGTPNPAEVIEYKGIGEGRRYFTNKYREILANSGANGHLRNVESLSRGFLDRVRITDPDGTAGFKVGDLVSYQDLQNNWTPRVDAKDVNPEFAKNMYLDDSVLHYTLGTRVTPSVIRKLKEHNITTVKASPTPPPFKAETMRIMDLPMTSKDWKDRLAGFNLQRGFTEAALHAGESKKDSVSYVGKAMEPTKFKAATYDTSDFDASDFDEID